MTIARFDDESPAYRKVRDELQEAEKALREQRERVAALRRTLPRDEVVEDLVFRELLDGKPTARKLSELFENPDQPLVLMQFMYGKKQENPCPMCSMWADGYNGAMKHLRQHMNFAVLVAGDVAEFRAFADKRGWSQLRIVSAAETSIKSDLGFETPEGGQIPGVSVFERQPDGRITHFYSQSAMMGDAGRGMDLLSPVWNYMDLTPEGRADWFPGLDYE
jgi:predicted dithiol-disulfide oxidoreductase (DUF899 family)